MAKKCRVKNRVSPEDKRMQDMQRSKITKQSCIGLRIIKDMLRGCELTVDGGSLPCCTKCHVVLSLCPTIERFVKLVPAQPRS